MSKSILYDHTRFIYALFALVTMLLGPLTRANFIEHTAFVTLYVGDALWALLIYWLIRFLIPDSKPTTSALLALIFSFSVELSQLYQADWINGLRNTTLGGLILGFGFKWSDLLAYSAGIVIGFMINLFLDSRNVSQNKITKR